MGYLLDRVPHKIWVMLQVNYLTIIHLRLGQYCRIISEKKSRDYSTIFTELRLIIVLVYFQSWTTGKFGNHNILVQRGRLTFKNFNTILSWILCWLKNCSNVKFRNFLIGNIWKPASGSHFGFIQTGSSHYIASYKEPLDQSDCWKLFVQLWNYTNN